MVSHVEAFRSDHELSRRLRLTWDAFFARFGRLTGVQRMGIPAILAGEEVALCAPTATGKTEAAVAPLVEMRLGEGREWTILYVSPTRALVNDLFERLYRPVSELGLRLIRRTGDHHDDLGKTAQLLLTTPESFDSLLSRPRGHGPGHALATVSAVVLDEVHLLFGGPRGEQVRWLLHRLRRLREYALTQGWIRGSGIQTVCLSATMPLPERLVSAYIPGGRLIQVAGGRTIEAVKTNVRIPVVEEALPEYLRSRGTAEKVLVFCNRRRRVDQLAVELKRRLHGTSYQVSAHHGSLAQRERERTEDLIRREEAIVVVATSTLEVGIDIGDIDLVVLDGPAPDVSSLLQRMGRGNRRTGIVRVLPCAGSMAEVVVQSAMLCAARDGHLGPVEVGPQYAVARQQLASFIFQGPSRARRRETLLAFLRAFLGGEDGALLLDHLVGEGELVENPEGIRLGEWWTERASNGEIHSNIEATLGQEVSDVETGDAIATGIAFWGGRGLSIAAQLLEVKRWNERRVEVRRSQEEGFAEGQWGYVTKKWLVGPGQPWALGRYFGIPEEEWPVLDRHDSSFVFHFGGARRQAVLDMAWRLAETPGSVRITPWYLQLPRGSTRLPNWVLEVGPGSLEVGIGQDLDRLERFLGRPFANRALPQTFRRREVQQWLQVPEEIKMFHNATITRHTDPEILSVLGWLVDG